MCIVSTPGGGSCAPRLRIAELPCARENCAVQYYYVCGIYVNVYGIALSQCVYFWLRSKYRCGIDKINTMSYIYTKVLLFVYIVYS